MILFTNTGSSFSLKNLFYKLKSILKKNKNNEVFIENKKVEVGTIIKIVELIIVSGLTAFLTINNSHSLFLKLNYQNIVIRIIMKAYIPLFICNTLNMLISKALNFIEVITLKIIATYFLGFVFASSVVFCGVVFKMGDMNYVQNKMIIYDDLKYDEKREEDGYKNDFDYINGKVEKTVSDLKEQYDIHDEEQLKKFKGSLISKLRLSYYGFDYRQSFWVGNDTMYIEFRDKKHFKNLYYIVNINEHSFEETYDDKFEKVKIENRKEN